MNDSELHDPWLAEFLYELEAEGIDIGTEKFSEAFSQTLRQVLQECGVDPLSKLKSSAPQMLADQHEVRERFEFQLLSRWGEALDLLEILVVITREAGATYAQEQLPKAIPAQDLTSNVLTRLHARACLVSSEVLHLLRGGYAAGAHARWRTLHEIAVVSTFVAQSSRDVAERYLLHEGVESYKSMLEYQAHCRTLGYELIPEDELDATREHHDELCERFGPGFRSDYGWAAAELGIKQPKFRDIEAAVSLDRLRPFYRMSGHSVHANPKGALFNLGLPLGAKDVSLAGASERGLADPGHSTAISLVQASVAVFTRNPTLKVLIQLHAMMQLTDEIGEALLTAHQAIESR